MKKYLICYWAERNGVFTNLEDIVEAESMVEALKNFVNSKVAKSISSISQIINPNYKPDFDYEKE